MRDDDTESFGPVSAMPSYEEKVAELGLLDEAEAVEAYFGVDDTGGEFVSDAHLLGDQLTSRQQLAVIRFEVAYNWAVEELDSTFELSVLYYLANDLLWEFAGEGSTTPPDPLRPFEHESIDEQRAAGAERAEGETDG